MQDNTTHITPLPDGKSFEYVSFAKLYPEPTFEVKRGKNWIEFGQKNLLPSYSESLLDKSADVTAIVNGTIAFVQGSGLVAPEGNPKATSMFQNGELNVAKPNDLSHVQGKLVRDLCVHGACLLNVLWREDRTGVAEVDYVDVRSMRIDSDGEGYWLSSDWSNPRKHEPEFFPSFNTIEGGSQLLYVKAPSSRNAPYGLPAHWSAREAIDLQAAMMKFNLKRVNNNFQVSAIISYDDIPTPEEQQKMNKALKDFVTGPDGDFTGGFIQTMGGGVTVTPFNSGSGPKDFEWISEFADQRIRSAFRVTGRGDLFGLGRGDGATFSSADDLLNEFETYSKLVVRPLQNVVLSIWNMLGEINKVNHTFEIDPFILFENDAIKTAEKGNEGENVLSGDTSSVPAIPTDGTGDVQAMALNGSQVESLRGIIISVAKGEITKETAGPLIRIAFPATPQSEIDAMLSGIVPTKQNPETPNDQIDRLT